MIFADKLINLRKKNGWSQEELAEKMNVSRQAVSKWESAQSIPELDKLLRLSSLFSVTTDYLLKDELEDEVYTSDSDLPAVKKVSLALANEYLQLRESASVQIALASFLCIISPVCLLILLALSSSPKLGITETEAVWVGLTALFIITATAVAIFILCSSKNSPYAFLENGPFECEYGVFGMVTERRRDYRGTYVKYNIIGSCLCILSPLALLSSILFGDNGIATVIMLTVTMTVAGIGVFFYIVAGVKWASYQRLLKEGAFSPVGKKRSRLSDTVSSVYWLVVTAIYLCTSFFTGDWSQSWIIWPVAGVIFGAIMAVLSALTVKDE